MNNIVLDELNYSEALRYMGYHGVTPNDNIMNMLRECAKEVQRIARPRYVYRIFDIHMGEKGIVIGNDEMIMQGNSIRRHLEGCEKAALMAVTVSEGIDRIIRTAQHSDIAKAVMYDSLSSVAVEQTCDKVEEIIRKEMTEYNQTWRYGIGYGDLSLELQPAFLKLLNAYKLIGLCTNKTLMMTPTKSVTAVIGLAKGELKQQVRGCVTCNMKETCTFRKKGGHCNV